MKSERWSRENFLEDVMSELRLTRKKNGNGGWRQSVPGGRRPWQRPGGLREHLKTGGRSPE